MNTNKIISRYTYKEYEFEKKFYSVKASNLYNVFQRLLLIYIDEYFNTYINSLATVKTIVLLVLHFKFKIKKRVLMKDFNVRNNLFDDRVFRKHISDYILYLKSE